MRHKIVAACATAIAMAALTPAPAAARDEIVRAARTNAIAVSTDVILGTLEAVKDQARSSSDRTDTAAILRRHAGMLHLQPAQGPTFASRRDSEVAPSPSPLMEPFGSQLKTFPSIARGRVTSEPVQRP